jgi:hypothetical protein
MSDLTVQFLDWVAARPRVRAEVIDAWSSTCPRLAIWEDALADGLVRYEQGIVTLTDAGRERVLGAGAASRSLQHPSRTREGGPVAV